MLRNISFRCVQPCRRFQNNTRLASSLVTNFEQSIQSSELREAVRYTNKNMKWSASEFKKWVDAAANAMIEQNYKPGDVYGIWLDESAEKHVSLLAAAKVGLKIVDIDPTIDSVADLRKALSVEQIKAIVFEPQTATKDNLLLLRKSIPEFFYYDDTAGQLFHSKYFPKLTYFIHTGFDIEWGCLNFKHLFLKHPETNYVEISVASLSDDLPLYTKITKGASGVEAGPVLSHADVLKSDLPSWKFAKNLISKTYFEV